MSESLTPCLSGSLTPDLRPLTPGRAFTIIEMLIVITIMLMLTAAALVMLGPALEGRKVREASRLVHGYLSTARMQAMETGRPVGVIFRSLPGATNCSITLEQCAVPPAYAGDMDNAVVDVQNWTFVPGTNTYYWPDHSTILKMRVRSGDFANNLIRHGDLIRLNSQGPIYEIVNDPIDDTITGLTILDFPLDTSTSTFVNFSGASGTPASDNNSDGFVDNYWLTLRLAPEYSQAIPWPQRPTALADILLPANWSAGMPFCVFRSPMSNGIASLQLPTATVVDFTASGVGNGVFPAGSSDIGVMFSTNGAVESYCVGPTRSPVTDPIFFLVGKRERMLNSFIANPTSAQQDQIANVQDLGNFWIVVNPLTGHISSDVVATGAATLPTTIIAARSLARDSQGMGGK